MISSALLQHSVARRERRALHIVTLTPFYPSQANPVSGCFIAEPLQKLQKWDLRSDVLVAEPFYRASQMALPDSPVEWIRFLSLPRGMGLSSAGAFLSRGVQGRIEQIHRQDPIDLIHAHSALPCGHAALLTSRRTGIPFAVTVHGLDAYSTHQVGRFSGPGCERVSREVYRDAKSVICVSGAVQNAVLELEPSARTVIVYNGVDCDFFSPHLVPERNNPTILAIGNLIPSKGHACLLRAFARIHHRFPSVRCQIIGQGSELPRLKLLSSNLGISGRVDWLGRQSRTEVREALRECAIFALPSAYEALGCVYLEAMATGKPVIACRKQGIEEIVRDGVNGYLIEPNDEHGLAEHLSVLLESPILRQKIGTEARRSMSRFTIQQQCERLLATYQECAK